MGFDEVLEVLPLVRVDPPDGLGSARKNRLTPDRRGAKSATNFKMGSRTSRWYRSRFSLNQLRSLFSANSPKKSKRAGVKCGSPDIPAV